MAPWSAAECQRKVVPLVARLCVCVWVLIATVSGQCTTDCSCAPSTDTGDRSNICCLTVRENAPPGTVIGGANDLPLVFNATPAQYFLDGSPLANELFRINVTTGIITTAVSIDRETDPLGEGDCVAFILDARESNDAPITPGGNQIFFSIVVLDENDNRPLFDVTHLNITVDESTEPDTLDCVSTELDSLSVTDADAGSNGEITFKVAEGTPGSHLFEVPNPSRPCVMNLVAMDRENTSVSYSFILVAMDGGNPPLSSSITVEFTLLDINDNAPMFLNVSGLLPVPEDTPVDSVIGRFLATDMDLDMEPLMYGLETSSAPFVMDSATGELTLTGTLNAEAPTVMYNLTITVRDSSPQHITTLNVAIEVTDVNEVEDVGVFGSPLPSELLEETINNSSDTPHLFALQVQDRDKSRENRVNTLEFVSGGEYFEAETRIIGGTTVFTFEQTRKIDRENVTNGVFQFSVLVIQQENPVISVPYEHNFTILDINDNEPYLTRKCINVSETYGNTEDAMGKVIDLNIIVADDDAGENGMITSFILMSVMSSNRGNVTDDLIASNGLAENSREIHEGQLYLPPMLDRESYGGVLTVLMTFKDGGTLPRNRTDSFMIKILDVNDNLPVFKPQEYTFMVMENRSPNEMIGTVYAEDLDDPSTGNGRIDFSLERTAAYRYFSIVQEGRIYSNLTFDRERNDTFVIYVSARDDGDPPKMANVSAKVTILITDENDEPPKFTEDIYMFMVETTANRGDFVGRVEAVDEDLDAASNPVFYKFLYSTPDFKIDNSSGDIKLESVLSIANSPYNLTVVAFNPGAEDTGDTASVLVYTVESAPIVIYAVSAGAAGFLLLAIFLLCCCICCLCRKSRNTGKYETDNPNLNNTKPILKTLPAANGQQRSVKFNTTVEETHYDPSGIAEDSVIRKESNFGSGDESPQTSLRITMSNGMNGVHEPDGIMDFEMSPSIINPNPSYSRHGPGRMPSPILLQEELNTSEFSQSTLSAIDDRNTYNSEGEEVESTYSDAPSNYNTSIPRFGRQTIQVEDHRHPGGVGHYGSHPPSHQSLDLHSHLPPVQHSSPGHFVELRAHNLARHEAQFASSSHPPPQGVGGLPPADDIRELSLSSLPRNIGQHHHHGSIGSSHGSSPPQRHLHRQLPSSGIHAPPPVSMAHGIMTPTSNSHANTRNYPHPLVMPEAFPSTRVPPHRFGSFIPSFTDYGETSTYASTELNEALEFKYEAEPDFCSLTATDYGENDTEL